MDFVMCVEVLLNYLNNVLPLPDSNFSKEEFNKRLIARWIISELIGELHNACVYESYTTIDEVFNEFKSKIDTLASINNVGQEVFISALDTLDEAHKYLFEWIDYFNKFEKVIGAS